ncbi:Haloacid dehalogenase-like hydrolase domain-containing protein 2 [Rhizophlyctis rosea]|nr:Haloacid dehalogenase-like hydrolase domain-containing protein 2 [Rhizophlyctis rosea]
MPPRPAILIDLSGTLHIDELATRNAPQALQKLRDAGFPLRFVSNTTKQSTPTLLKHLTSLSFTIHKFEVFTSLTAARALVQKLGVKPLLFLEDDARGEFEGVESGEGEGGVNAVVVGLCPGMFCYDKLTEAMRIIQAGGKFIAIHKARYYATPQGLSLGPGALVAALEYATDIKAEVVGKPQPSFFQLALSDLRVDPSDAIMIGDDVRDDVGGAMEVGMRGVLVKTGKYQSGDENNKGVKPTKVVEDFAEAVDWILTEYGG